MSEATLSGSRGIVVVLSEKPTAPLLESFVVYDDTKAFEFQQEKLKQGQGG